VATELRETRGRDEPPPPRRSVEDGQCRPPPGLTAPATAWIWAFACGLFALYAIVSVRLHLRMLSTGFDLGLNEQAVRGWAHGHWPIVELEGPGFNQLGDHFSPVLATIAPLYRVFPSPITLLLVQAALLAVAAVPLTAWAQRVAGRPAAVVVALGYGLSWGIAGAVGFDFHEVCFAVPLMAFCAVALGERRYPAAACWALPMLLVKEDLGVTVAVVGALIAWGGRRRLGLVTVAAGLGASAVEVLVLIPHFTPGGTFSAWRAAHGSVGAGGFGGVSKAFTIGLFQPDTKPTTVVLLLAPTAFLALRSRLILLAVPTLLWRFASSYWTYWSSGFHYNAVLMPVVFAALVETISRWSPAVRATRLRETLVAGSVVTAMLLPAHAFWSVVEPSTWRHSHRVDDAGAVLAVIPDGTQVQATNRLAAQLAGRTSVSMFGRPGERPNPEWIVIEDAYPQNWPFNDLDEQRRMVEVAQKLGYQKVAQRGDFVLLHRPPDDTRQFPPPPS